MQTCKPAGSTLHSNSNKYNKISPKMSVTSSATVSRDREVQSPDSVQDKLLVVSITKRDGTLLDASSILEEDIMELCIRWTHTCPLGVLRYSMADSVPTQAHITAFIEMWHSNPAAREGEPHTPPYQTPSNKETLHCIHVQLGDLNDNELWQLVRDLSQEIAQCKSRAPPAIPFLKIGHACWAAVSQRKMTRRSPFQEGEGSLLDHHHGQ